MAKKFKKLVSNFFKIQSRNSSIGKFLLEKDKKKKTFPKKFLFIITEQKKIITLRKKVE